MFVFSLCVLICFKFCVNMVALIWSCINALLKFGVRSLVSHVADPLPSLWVERNGRIGNTGLIMGVKDLWKLLEPVGRPVRLESLQGLVLAVDISIWLNQAVKGMRDKKGEPVPNAHLILLYHRICKLLYHHIKPIFVFDGATPFLKQQTLAARRHKRDKASQNSVRAAHGRVNKFLQAKILEQVTGEKSRVSMSAITQHEELDMFQLPPLPKDEEHAAQDLDIYDLTSEAESANYHRFVDVGAMNMESEDFVGLPPEVQHELLLERQEIEKYTYHKPGSLPQIPEDFSSYQLSQLLTRSQTSKKLENVRKVLKSNDATIVTLGEESQVQEVESNRILSSDSAHYILVKGMDMEGMSNSSQLDEEPQSQGSSTGEFGSKLECPVMESGIGREGQERLDLGSRDFAPVDEGRKNVADVHDAFMSMVAEDYIMLGDSDSEEVALESMDGQLTLMEDIRKSLAKKKSVSIHVLGRDDYMMTESGVPVMALHTPDARPHLSPTSAVLAASLVRPSSPSTSATLLMSPPSSSTLATPLVRPPSSSTSDVPLVGPSSPSISDVKFTPVAPLVKPTTFTVKVLSPSTSDTPPLSSSTSAISLVKPPTSSTSATSLMKSPTPFTSSTPPLSSSTSAIPLVKPPTPSTSDTPPLSSSTSATPLVKLPPSFTSVEPIEYSMFHEQVNESIYSGEESGRNKVLLRERIATVEDFTELEQVGGEVDVRGGEGGGGDDGEDEFSALVAMEASVAQQMLGEEAASLEREQTRQARAAASVANQMYKDAQELLSLFGLPFLVSPEEAEAQCAALERNRLSQGCITDDNDVFLFGGMTVYRNFFSQNKELELYQAEDIENRLSLSRERLVLLAYLLGSDYTEGLEGVGVVSAMELLRDFPGSQLEPLEKLKKWHDQVNLKPPLPKNEKSLHRKLRESCFAADFPCSSVWDAYLMPAIDSSMEEFEWGSPDLDLLRSFAESRIGWDMNKVDELLLPVLKRMNSRDLVQPKITQFFTKTGPKIHPSKAIKSRRLRNAVLRIQSQGKSSGSDEVSSQSHVTSRKRPLMTRKSHVTSRKSPVTRRANKREMRSRKQVTKKARSNQEEEEVDEEDRRMKSGFRRSKKLPAAMPCGLSASSSSSSSSSGEDEFDLLVKDVDL